MKKNAIVTYLLAFALLLSACASSGLNANGGITGPALQESMDSHPLEDTVQSDPAQDDTAFEPTSASSPTGSANTGGSITFIPETSMGDDAPSLTIDSSVTIDGENYIYGPYTFRLTARIFDQKYTYCMELYDCEDTLEVAEIPATVSGCPVVAIGSTIAERPCFQDNVMLKKVVIPDTVEYIGCYAFSGCVNLEEVVIPDEISLIGSHAFSDCTSLKDLKVPASVKSIGYFAFTDCPGLKELRITADMSVYENALYFASGLETLIIEDGVTTLPDLSGRNNLTELYIPDSVTSVGSFSGCKDMTSVRLSGGVSAYSTDYGDPLFDCTKVSFIDVGDGVAYLDSHVFGNETLESIILPSTLTYIGEYVFWRVIYNSYSEEEYIAAPLKEVFFRGTEEQCLQELKDQVANTGATIYYFSEEEPTEEGDFWHYVDGKPVIW